MSGTSDLDREIDAALDRSDERIELGEVALLMAAREYPDTDLSDYRDHLAAVQAATCTAAAGASNLADRVTAIRNAVFETHGYQGDSDTYGALDNANLIKVIDRRRGIPVSLAIICLEAARGQGWAADGINFPGHFLLRLRDASDGVIVDPFHGGRTLGVEDLRAYLKSVAGDHAELAPEHYAPIGNRGILLRLQNNLRLRAPDAGELDRAVLATTAMIKLAPEEVNLWYELAELHIARGALDSAIEAADVFDDRARSSTQYARGKALRAKLRRKLH